jgi:Flp pilus assembly protein TadD
MRLAGLFSEEGNTAEAMEAYRGAMDTGNTEIAPLAALQLGHLLRQAGDLVEARSAYRRASYATDPFIVSDAAVALNAISEKNEPTG